MEGGGGGSQIKIDLIFLRRRVGLSAVTYFVGCHVLPWRVTLCFSLDVRRAETSLFCFAESETKSSHTRRLCGLTIHKACTEKDKVYNMELRNMAVRY